MTGKTDDAVSPDGASASRTASAAGIVCREMSITNKRGLHARASAKFVQMVEQFNADVKVTRNGETVGANSIMGLMMLSAGVGTTITVCASGPEAEAAIAAIAELVSNKFNEDE